jgi:hypothetical protein
VTEHDLHYLRSILGNLRALRKAISLINDVNADLALPSLGSEVLADNIDWLDCFIDKHEREDG